MCLQAVLHSISVIYDPTQFHIGFQWNGEV